MFVSVLQKLKKQLRAMVLMSALMMMGIPGDGGAGDPPPADPPAGDPPAADPPPADDLSTLFSPEEVSAKREALTAAKAEEDRRAGLTEEQRTAEDAEKAAKDAEEKAKAGAPEEYADFTFPEGVEVDTGILTEFKALSKEANLPQDKAQAFIDQYTNKIMPEIVKRQADQWQEQLSTWKEETLATKEIKLDAEGRNLDGIRVINSLLSKEEGDALRADFDTYGLGNNKGINLLLTRMAKQLKEDTFEDGGRGNQGGSTSIAKRLYPNLPD